MHILLTNDDGPPSPHSSPYVHSLVRSLQCAGHIVSVCLPHTQRSWIGKAHLIGKTLKPTYYRPPSPTVSPLPAGLGPEDDSRNHGTTHTRPSPNGAVEEWVLVDGTPASAVQIGLHHFFSDRGPIELVLSGPNYGRNTTAVFALSSGTLGGALEAAACGVRAIALSYAFFTRNHDPSIVAGASRHAVRVVEALIAQWPTDGSVDLYSVNVPLVEGVERARSMFAPMLQNYWTVGSSAFKAVEGAEEEEEEEEEEEGDDEQEERIRVAEVNGGEVPDGSGKKGLAHKHFKWAPKLGDVMKAVEEAPPHVDGRVIRAGETSITPLRANFQQAQDHLASQELKLVGQTVPTTITTTLPIRSKSSDQMPTSSVSRGDIIYATVDYEDAYVRPTILSALCSLIPRHQLRLVSSPDDVPPEVGLAPKILQIRDYESIDFASALSAAAGTSLINSYVIRKALIRKHYLSATIDHWVAKHPHSVLKTHTQRGEHIEVDYAEFLDDALAEAWDLRKSMEANEGLQAEERAWWILKPGMSDRGQGIRLFSTREELQGIFDVWEAETPPSDDEGQDNDDGDDDFGRGRKDGDMEEEQDFIATSHLRHFVTQPYIHPPLLLPSCEHRKFHIRAYVLCVGALHVYVAREMLALFAAKPYSAPWETPADDANYRYMDAHLTNTCLQAPPQQTDALCVQPFWALSDADLPLHRKERLFAQIGAVTGELFEAAARGTAVHFQPLPGAFEVYGLDFLVDAQEKVWLLEVNAFPDFKQTGDDLRERVVEGLWRGVVRWGVGPWAGVVKGREGDKEMVLVRKVDLGRR